jgi:lipopolysaccharide export LptBFGC system permease protein LptF
MGGVLRKVRTDGDSEDPLPPIELYKLAVEEYRFQAEFNWKRTQYLLAFNAAILAAGTAVAGRFGEFAIPVFGLGVVACVLAMLVQRQQHSYYRAARDRMRRLEMQFEIPEPVDTTATLGKRTRTVSVTGLIYVLTTAIAVADVVAIVYSLN